MEYQKLNAVIIGLGSMGKRRVRCLKALGVESIYGVDPRQDRRQEAQDKYGISVSKDFKEVLETFSPDVVLISTPPQLHMDYAFQTLDKKISTFIEASVVEKERVLELSQLAEKEGVFYAPSCTMRFFEAPELIKKWIGEKRIGNTLYFNYQTGQYLPDWHPWEDIQDFYVSQRETGGAREIVPFELTWLNDIFGEPKPLSCFKNKLSNMNADIDDFYHCSLSYGKVIGNMTVEVLSRPEALREMTIVGSEGLIILSSLNGGTLRYKNTEMNEWEIISLGKGSIEAGYINPEEPYIKEVECFLKSHLQGGKGYPNSLEDDYKILNTLEELEKKTGDKC